MKSLIDSPRATLGVGVALAAAILLVWLIAAGANGLALATFLVRLVHVLSLIHI